MKGVIFEWRRMTRLNDRKKPFCFLLLVTYSISILLILIVFFTVLSRFAYGSTASDFGEDIPYMLKMIYSKIYKFHFSNITVFFILLLCQYIRKAFCTESCVDYIILICINLLYIIIVICIFLYFKSHDIFFVDNLTKKDCTVVAFALFFSQYMCLYFRIKGEKSINKKYIKDISSIGNPIFFCGILYLYFAQYSYMLTYDDSVFVWFSSILFLIIIILFFKNVYIVKNLDKYCLCLKEISRDYFVYVYSTDYDIGRNLFEFFIKPCIKNMHYNSLLNNIFDGCVLSREQYESCKYHLKDNICIGIDCYSRLFLKNDNIRCLKEFCYSVAIKEQTLFQSEERDSLNILKKNYSDVLTVKNFKELNNPFLFKDFFEELRKNSQYMYEIKNARKEILKSKEITNIEKFDEYLILVLDRLEYETDRYTIFNIILKGYEAITHFICAFYLCHLEVRLSDYLDGINVMEKVENGSLGSWLELTHSVLKRKKYLENSWLKSKIGNNISELFSKINYPAQKSVDIKPAEQWYNFLNNRLVNLRNNTIGHGSSAFIPADEGLVCMYKIYLYMLNEVRMNFKNLELSKEQVWIIEIDNKITFLNKITPEINELRYIDYLSEKLVPIQWRSSKDVITE